MRLCVLDAFPLITKRVGVEFNRKKEEVKALVVGLVFSRMLMWGSLFTWLVWFLIIGYRPNTTDDTHYAGRAGLLVFCFAVPTSVAMLVILAYPLFLLRKVAKDCCELGTTLGYGDSFEVFKRPLPVLLAESNRVLVHTAIAILNTENILIPINQTWFSRLRFFQISTSLF